MRVGFISFGLELKTLAVLLFVVAIMANAIVIQQTTSYEVDAI